MDRIESVLVSAAVLCLIGAVAAPGLGVPDWSPVLLVAAAGTLAAAKGVLGGVAGAVVALAIGRWIGDPVVPTLAGLGALALLFVALGARVRHLRRRREAVLASWLDTARTLQEAHAAREAAAALPGLALRLVGPGAAAVLRRGETGWEALTPVDAPPADWPTKLFESAIDQGWAEGPGEPLIDGRGRPRWQIAVALPGPEVPTILWLQLPRRLGAIGRKRLLPWARVAGAGLGRLDALDRLTRAAYTDPLTGLGSRRAFEERLREEMARALRYGHPLGLVLLDLDGFKQINDTRGHPEGDRLLRLVAQTLRRTRREADLLYRWGGDEFAVLLPNTSSAGARQAALRYAEAVEGASGPLRLRACVGYAGTDEGHAHASELVRAADDRLYAQKAASRQHAT